MREQLLRLANARPFQPFLVHLSDGTIYTILHPEQMMISPAYVIIGIRQSNTPGADIQDSAIVALQHIVQAIPFTRVVPPTSNGPAA